MSSGIDYSKWNDICSDSDSYSSLEEISQHKSSKTLPDQELKIPQILQKRIIDKVSTNRITIIVGGTGCGKSTLVPQLLLQHFGKPILCTQPRRLAVVAVSTHVAKQRNTPLGKEVGYHIGQTKQFVSRETALLFASAGILLEDLRANGLEALTKYQVILIDECHERSSESDLCLASIKSFMKAYPKPRLRVVLMSATFNHGRYASYFDGIPGCDYVDTITLETGGSIRAFYSNVETFYLADILRMLPPEWLHYLDDTFLKEMRRNPNSELTGKTLSPSLLMLILLLVLKLDKEEKKDAIFLIFAPTYSHLEQIYIKLTEVHSLSSLVSVLHSSIDMEDCLKSMHSKKNQTHKRQILLASAIADSSVTIPGVTCVIDTCRMLEVRWDPAMEAHIPKTVWASKSICDQRRGRTGRTCSGRVFRLLDQSFYINHLETWDQPQIELASCRDEVLTLLSTTNKVMSDPKELLQKCMDPPPEASLRKAIQYLQKIGACQEISISHQKKKLIPTNHGKLLAALPFTASSATMIRKGAHHGLLHEVLALITIQSTRPFPILHVFGDNYRNEMTLKRFYSDAEPKDPKSVALANLAAYLVWQIQWNTRIRGKAARRRFLNCTNLRKGSNFDNYDCILYSDEVATDDASSHDCNVWNWTETMEEAHSKWCEEHSINPTSVRAISSSIQVAMNILYKKEHEPDWLRCQHAHPLWELKLADDLISDLDTHQYDILGEVYGNKRKKEICSLLTNLQETNENDVSSPSCTLVPPQSINTKPACMHFLLGNCRFGDKCKNAHSYSAPRPLCRFYPECTKRGCLYSHKRPQQISTNHSTDVKLPPIHSKYQGGALVWYQKAASTLLLFGEADFCFTEALYSLQIFPMIATTNASDPPISAQSYCNLTNVDATCCHMDQRLSCKPITHFAWNFPFTGEDENDTIHESLISGAFMSVAQYIANNGNGLDAKFEFGMALQGDQFSRWSILKSAQRAGFYLEWWDTFNVEEFPGYHPKRGNGDTFPAQDTRFYVFQFRNYAEMSRTDASYL